MEEGPALSPGDRKCVLTSDPCFSRVHPHELVEDGLVYRVRGCMTEGLNALAMAEPVALLSDGTLPLKTIDVVRWAGLHHLRLDKAGFIKHWQRYVGALQEHIESAGSPQDTVRANALLLQAHEFARRLLHGFDELDFLVGASEDSRGPLAVLQYTDKDPWTPYLYFLAAGVTLVAEPERT